MRAAKYMWMAVLAFVVVAELLLVAMDKPLLTFYIRRLTEPWQSLTAFAFGVLFGHFYWCNFKGEK